MGILYRKKKIVLNFKEDKPTVYKAAQIMLPTITTDELFDEISQSCGVGMMQTKAVVAALENRLVHYVKIGHPVRIGEFGSLHPRIRVKTTLSAEDANAATVTKKYLYFVPGTKLKDSVLETSIDHYGAFDEE